MAEAARAIDFYCSALTQLRDQLARVLGAQTVDVIIQRAASEIEGSFPEARLIRYEDGELNLEEMRTALASKDEGHIRASFTALQQVVTLVLARLLGRATATKLVGAGLAGGA